jgi:ABC-type sugar transport system substrate-binding protein
MRWVHDVRSTPMTAGGWKALRRSVAACLVAVPAVLAVGAPAAQAQNGDTHITVYGSNQTVFYKNGEPSVWDRGRELGMMNRIDRVPA